MLESLVIERKQYSSDDDRLAALANFIKTRGNLTAANAIFLAFTNNPLEINPAPLSKIDTTYQEYAARTRLTREEFIAIFEKMLVMH